MEREFEDHCWKDVIDAETATEFDDAEWEWPER